MKNMKLLGVSLAVVVSVFTGCVDDESASFGDTSDLSFPVNAVSAKPTLENGKKVENATATNQIGGVPGLNSVSNNSKLNTALLGSKISKRLLKHIKDTNIESYSLNETIDSTDECPSGGTLRSYGSANETNEGSITFTAVNCNDGYEIINGSVYITMKNFDDTFGDFKDMTVKFMTDFTMKKVSDDSMAKISANSYMAVSVINFSYGNMQKFKSAMSLQATDGSEKYGLKDCEFYFKDNGDEMEMYQTKGKVYIDSLASYVDYDTDYDMSETPFVFSDSVDAPISGEARYNMADNGKVKIKVESNKVKTYVDANGDGVYELSE